MNDPRPTRRKHTRREVSREHGRIVVEIVCPFCGETVRTTVWSLAGSGKRCLCGAKHNSAGTTRREDV